MTLTLRLYLQISMYNFDLDINIEEYFVFYQICKVDFCMSEQE